MTIKSTSMTCIKEKENETRKTLLERREKMQKNNRRGHLRIVFIPVVL